MAFRTSYVEGDSVSACYASVIPTSSMHMCFFPLPIAKLDALLVSSFAFIFRGFRVVLPSAPWYESCIALPSTLRVNVQGSYAMSFMKPLTSHMKPLSQSAHRYFTIRLACAVRPHLIHGCMRSGEQVGSRIEVGQR